MKGNEQLKATYPSVQPESWWELRLSPHSLSRQHPSEESPVCRRWSSSALLHPSQCNRRQSRWSPACQGVSRGDYQTQSHSQWCRHICLLFWSLSCYPCTSDRCTREPPVQGHKDNVFLKTRRSELKRKWLSHWHICIIHLLDMRRQVCAQPSS